MPALIVNIALLAAVLVLLGVWLFTSLCRRRQDRRRDTEERRLILQAFTGTAAQPRPVTSSDVAAGDPPPPVSLATPAATGHPQLDAESVAALLDLLEDRRPARRGLIGGLIDGPRNVWSAGELAGRNVGNRTMGGPRPVGGAEPSSDLYRDAAAELIDIHARDPRDAHEQYQRYAAALADPALAELYVRSAAYATYAERGAVRQVVDEIIGLTCPPKASDSAQRDTPDPTS